MDGKSLNITQEKINQLKQIFPEVFKEDKVDFLQLKALLGEDVIAKDEVYGLSWAGKYEAFKEIQKQTTASLIPDREGSIDFDNAENIFIEGENLEVLRVLQKSYYGKIKMIYIDPPYNTGNDSFVYPDDYTERRAEYEKRAGITNAEGFLNKQDLWKKNTKENGQYHSVWLSMMYPRLYLAKNLLKEDGVIFISIDDNEVFNLKILLDEIFGEENHVATIVWEKKYSPANDAKYLSVTHEYIILYAKNKEIWRPILEERTEEMNNRYKNFDNDPRGPWKPGGFSVKTYTANYDYPIETPAGNIVYPPKGSCWQTKKENYLKLLEDNRIYFGKNKDAKPQIKQFLSEVKQGLVTKTLWTHSVAGNTQISMQEIEKIFGNKVFDTPKPTRLLKKIINIAVKPHNDDIILDFFAGSATTAHAVLELNEIDNGNRKFICIQIAENTNDLKEANKLGYNNVAEISYERIKKIINNIISKNTEKTDFKNNTIGVRKYKMVPTNIKQWKIENDSNLIEQLKLYVEPINMDNDFNIAVEIMIKEGYTLNSKIEKINADNSFIYFIEKNFIIIVNKINNNIINQVLNIKPNRVICLDKLFEHNDALKTNFALQLKENNIYFKFI